MHFLLDFSNISWKNGESKATHAVLTEVIVLSGSISLYQGPERSALCQAAMILAVTRSGRTQIQEPSCHGAM
jgi:hypothetical protein